MNNILEVLLIVFLIFAPVFLMLEAILFIRPKECWVGVTNIFINSWVFLQEKWRYFFMSRLEKINHVSTQINQTSDLAEQKNLLAQLKHLANKYRKEREGELHPKKSRLEVGNWSYQPWVRFSLLVLTSFVFYGLVFVLFWLFGKNPIDTLKAWLAMDQDPRGFATVVVAVFAAVPALLLWFYRDLNSYREREGSHRDVMFQEHKQLVEWATTETKPDTKDSAETETETKQITSSVPMIQVAGIYQLAPFLKDHHANLYQRSTLETLRAIVNSGRPKWDKWVVQFEWWVGKGMKGRMPEKPALTAAEKAVHAVLRENSILFYHQYFNAMDFNLAGFDASDLVFIGCDLEGAQLEGGNFQCVDFYGSNMRDASLQGANMSEVGLQCVNLNGADLLGADLTDAVLIGADMYHCNGLIISEGKIAYN
jgi:hypothetical protein